MKKFISSIVVVGLLGSSTLSVNTLSKNDSEFLGLTSTNAVALNETEMFDTNGKAGFLNPTKIDFMNKSGWLNPASYYYVWGLAECKKCYSDTYKK